jgi:PHD/YefM family antitoxin component YafN of YafNO toxin-antitoxin module
MTVHPQIIEKDGRKEFVVLPYAEFLAMQEALEDYEDLKILRREKAESAGDSTLPLDEVLREIEGREG